MSKRDFVIISDSNCDLTPTQAAALHLPLIPMPFIVDDVDYSGEPGNSLTADEFYQKMRNGALTKTYQKSPENYKAALLPFLKEGKDVILVNMSIQLSATHNSSLIARNELLEEFPDAKIVCMDSSLISCGQGLLVEEMLAQKATGADMEAVVAFGEELKKNINVCFTMDDLTYVCRGGRLSKSSAVLGTLMNIKPIMCLAQDGSLKTIDKVRGRKVAIQALCEFVAKRPTNTCNKLYVMHADCPNDAKLLANLIKKAYKDIEICISTVGFSVGSHAGPGTLALAFVGEPRQ